MRSLKSFAARCAGCRLCLLACSFYHGQVFSIDLARMMVTGDQATWAFEPIVCRQCPDAPCAAACPVSAISRDSTNGAVLLDADACIACGTCVVACPYGAVVQSPVTNAILLCDLCGGNPECVLACPHGAIEFSETDAAEEELAETITTIWYGEPVGL